MKTHQFHVVNLFIFVYHPSSPHPPPCRHTRLPSVPRTVHTHGLCPLLFLWPRSLRRWLFSSFTLSSKRSSLARPAKRAPLVIITIPCSISFTGLISSWNSFICWLVHYVPHHLIPLECELCEGRSLLTSFIVYPQQPVHGKWSIISGKTNQWMNIGVTQSCGTSHSRVLWSFMTLMLVVGERGRVVTK